MNRNLQQQLTLSHLAVTMTAVFLLVAGILGGYVLYLQSDFNARWAAQVASNIAYDFPMWAETDGAGLFPNDYIRVQFIEVYDDPDLPAIEDEWLIMTDLNGIVIGSNYPQRYPVGANLLNDLPPALSTQAFEDVTNMSGFLWDNAAQAAYTNENGRHIGIAPIPALGDEIVGYVYYYVGDHDNAYQFQQTAQTVLWVSLLAALVSTFLSGLMGYRLSRFFGRRLDALQKATSAFSTGNLSERVQLSGEDEFAHVGRQFNSMADMIATQIEDLRRLADQNAQLAEDAEAFARVEERNRLARELHDAIKQELFGLNLTLGAVSQIVPSQPTVAQEKLGELVTQTQQIQMELDAIIQQLRPAQLQDKGLVVAVRELTERWSAQTGVTVDFWAEEARSLPIHIEQAGYRIVQEGLGNAGKHAKASQIKIALVYTAQTLTITLEDDGVGFDPNQLRHTFGLTNMRQRTETHGGIFTIDTKLGQGTTLTARFPLEKWL